MKRSVFLCLFLVSTFFSVTIEQKSVKAETDIEVEHELILYEDDYYIRRIEVSGKYDFVLDIGCEAKRYYINDVLIYQDMLYFYGYKSDKAHPKTYQAWIMEVDYQGEIIHSKAFFIGDLAEVVDVLTYDEEGLLFLVEESISEGRYIFVQSHLIRFDPYFDDFSKVTIDFQVVRKEKQDQYWLLSENYHGHYELGVKHDLSILHKEDIVGIEAYQEVTETIKIEFINSVLINNERYTNGAIIDYPGHYILQFDEAIIPFTVHPKIIGVEEGLITSQAIAIYFSGGQAFLNGEIYVSDTLIDEPGNYTLIIKGVGGYEKKIEFTIDADLEGVLHNQIYQSPRTLTFNGTAYLNHRPFKSGNTIQDSGVYTLDIYGTNGYHERHHFHLDLEETTTNSPAEVKIYRFGILAILVIALGTITYLVKFKK